MPVPKPHEGKARSEFVSRCMSAIGDEYEQDQALAICFRQWRGGKGDGGSFETKTLPLAETGIELKFADGGNTAVKVTGYASTFGNLDHHGDIIQAGAFAKSIGKRLASGRTLPMRYEHKQEATIGKWLHFLEDSKGLRVEGELTPGHRLAEDVAALLRHEAVEGLSIGYRVLDHEVDRKGVRLLKEIALSEISVVGTPANEEARVLGVKSADGIKSLREFETFLREHGWSRREAEAIATKGFASLARDERGDGASERRDDGTKAGELLAVLRGLRSNLSSRLTDV